MFATKFQLMRRRRIAFGVIPALTGVGILAFGVNLQDGLLLGFGLSLCLHGTVGILRPQAPFIVPSMARVEEIERILSACDQATIGGKVLINNLERLGMLSGLLAVATLVSRTFGALRRNSS